MARTHKLEKLLADIPDKTHGPWWRYFVANHDVVARMLESRSMPSVVEAIGKLIGLPPVSRASAWESWRSAQAHVARIRSARPAPVRTPPSAPRARPAPITAPARVEAGGGANGANGAGKKPMHPSKIFD